MLLHTRREAFPYHGDILAWHLVRLLSVALGAVTVWATWRIACAIVPDDETIARGAAAFVAFLPGFLFISAAVNNDSLVITLSSLSVLEILRISRRPSRREIWILGLLLGLSLLAKLSGIVVWLFATAFFFWIMYETREWKNTTVDLVLCFGIAIVSIAPWLVYNMQEYGDPFAWSVYQALLLFAKTL